MNSVSRSYIVVKILTVFLLGNGLVFFFFNQKYINTYCSLFSALQALKEMGKNIDGFFFLTN